MQLAVNYMIRQLIITLQAHNKKYTSVHPGMQFQVKNKGCFNLKRFMRINTVKELSFYGCDSSP